MNSRFYPRALWGYVAFVFATLFYILLIYSPSWVTNWYHTEHFSILNQLARSEGTASLDFYMGKTDRLWFGPLKQVFAGLAFAVVAFQYLQNARTPFFFICTFIYFVASRPEILAAPPYGDAVGGPFMEALWLAKHNFDYAGLARQADYVHGGPKVYLFSFYPTLQAVMLRLIPDVKTFLLTNHLLSLAFAAGTAAYFRRAVVKVFSPAVGMLAALLLLATPIFQSQAEMINMEMPHVFFAVMAVAFLSQRCMARATVAAILAASIKGTAILICGVVFFAGVTLFLFDSTRRFAFSRLSWACVAAAFAGLQYYASFYILNEGGHAAMVGVFQGWPSLVRFKNTYVFGASLLIFAATALGGLIFRRDEGRGMWFDRNYVPAVMFASGAAWFALFLQSYSVSPRYHLLWYPFVVFGAVYALRAIVRRESWLRFVLVLAIGGMLFCDYGAAEAVQDRSHVILERSLEYRNDQRKWMNLARLLEEQYSHMTIGVPAVYAHSLAFPELGYVTKDLDIMIYAYPSHYDNIKNFRGLQHVDFRKVIWVGVESKNPYYPMGPQDHLEQKVIFGDKEILLFRGGFSIDIFYRQIERQAQEAFAAGEMLRTATGSVYSVNK